MIRYDEFVREIDAFDASADMHYETTSHLASIALGREAAKEEDVYEEPMIALGQKLRMMRDRIRCQFFVSKDGRARTLQVCDFIILTSTLLLHLLSLQEHSHFNSSHSNTLTSTILLLSLQPSHFTPFWLQHAHSRSVTS